MLRSFSGSKLLSNYNAETLSVITLSTYLLHDVIAWNGIVSYAIIRSTTQSAQRIIYVILYMNIGFSDTQMYGIPMEFLSAYNLAKKD